MDLTKTTLPWSQPILDSQRTYEESSDAIVPDTYPDIQRICAAYGCAQLKDDAPQSGRLLISGAITVTVLYTSDGGVLRRMTIPISFAHIEECSDISESSPVFVSCQVVSTSAQITNSRKLSVSAILSVRCTVFSQQELSLTSGVASSDTEWELLSSTYTLTLPYAVQRQEFTIMDDLEQPDIRRFQDLFAPCCDLRMTECQILGEKAVLKGECILHLLGLTQEQEVDHLDCSLPFTQIFDAPSFTDHHPLGVRFSLRHLDVERLDETQLSIGIGINILLTAFATHTVPAIEDIYHLTYPVHVDTQSLALSSTHPVNDLACEGTETIPAGMRIVSVADARAALDTILYEENRTVLRLMVCVLYRSDDKEYYTLSRAVHMPLHLPDGITTAQVTGILCRASAAISGETSVVLSLSGRCSLLCEETLHIRDITALELDTTAQPEPLPVSLILRCVEPEERLWDIAKYYHTTVDAIRQANQISEENHRAASHMLLIPLR